jgi:DNA polymerase-4
MNMSTAENIVQWLFLDINAFFASCEQQETPALRGKPIIVVQTLTDSACAIAASYPAKRLGAPSSWPRAGLVGGGLVG